MKGFKELMKAKGQKKMDPMEKEAKTGILKEISKMAGDMMGSDLKGLKKVTVAAPDKEGLEKGLEKAKELMGDMPEGEEAEAEEDEAVASEEEMPAEEMSVEEIEAKIKELEAKKAAMVKE
jgi:hypothetical protein